MLGRLHLGFDLTCVVALLAGAAVAGIVGGALSWWTYDQAGDA